MSNRIDTCFEALSGTGAKALIPFITVGDPDPAWTVDIMHALVKAGADLLELGVPFSDPAADGPVIQLASERAISRGCHAAQCAGYGCNISRPGSGYTDCVDGVPESD